MQCDQSTHISKKAADLSLHHECEKLAVIVRKSLHFS